MVRAIGLGLTMSVFSWLTLVLIVIGIIVNEVTDKGEKK
jgi:hypothetical protein